MKTYELKDTRDPDLGRFVDREGNWTHYLHKPTNTVLRGGTTILDQGWAKGVGFYQYLANNSASEIEAKLEAAGEKGSKIHAFFEMMLSIPGNHQFNREQLIINPKTGQEEQLTHEEWDLVLAASNFLTAHGATFLGVERSVKNLKEQYAMTLDWGLILTKACDRKLCKCKNVIGKPGIVDLKTGGGIYNSHAGQVAGQCYAEDIVEKLGVQPTWTGLLRPRKTGTCEFVVFDEAETKENYLDFLAAKRMAFRQFPMFDPTKDIEEIPDAVAINVVYQLPEIKKVKKGRKVSAKKVKKNAKTTSNRESAQRPAEAQVGA